MRSNSWVVWALVEIIVVKRSLVWNSVVWCRVVEGSSWVWCWVVTVWVLVFMSRNSGAIWVVCVIEVRVSVMLSTEAPVTVKSLMAIEGVVISVLITLVVSVSPMSIIEVVGTECKWLSVV